MSVNDLAMNARGLRHPVTELDSDDARSCRKRQRALNEIDGSGG
jgi:hypothetical protein